MGLIVLCLDHLKPGTHYTTFSQIFNLFDSHHVQILYRHDLRDLLAPAKLAFLAV